jgi:hypothetical protein
MGVMQATGDVLVIADADVVIEPSAIAQAITMLAAGVPWVVPHTNVMRLDEASTNQLLAQDPADAVLAGQLTRPAYTGFAGGGIIVVTRETWILSGGIPHEFAGWGGEDEALAVILDTLCGPHVRLTGDLWHLWHQPADKAAKRDNRTVLAPYLRAAGDPAAMRHLIINGTELFESDGKVQMLTTDEFRRGSRVMKPGDVFMASPDEARRHATRSRKVAKRISPLVFEAAGNPRHSGNGKFNPSSEDRKLAAARERMLARKGNGQPR